MVVCPRCQATFEDAALNFCGRCGSDMRGPERPAVAGSAMPALASQDPGPDNDPLIGAVIDGRYRILTRIGSGGMGAVYKVEHVAMGKVAALKMLHPTLSTDREVVKRFRREAQAVSMLTHPNTVQVFDFGQSQGCLYMVMEYVKGQDLAAILRRDGPLSWEKAAPLAAQICDALAEAHEAGIVHRDLKPENILVTRGRDARDVAKVLDFGLAKLRQMEALDGATARGSVIGTPYYMSPEQIRAEEPDARSDIYSFGAMMYRVLTGDPPFGGASPLAVLSAHLAEPLTPMSKRKPDQHFDPRVEAIIARCLEKDRDQRFPTIDEVRQAIQESRGPDRSPIPLPSLTPPSLTPPNTTSTHQHRRESTSAPSGVVPLARREDFDRFERSLRWRRVFALSLVPLVLLSVAAGAWYYFKHMDTGGFPVEVEAEPNNTPTLANLIASGKTVRGHIGQRIDVENSDRDFYRVQVDEGTYLLRLDLTGIPNMDLHLALFDGAGKHITDSDSDGPGAGEVIPNQRLHAGEYYIEVREVWVSGRQATENLSDWYTLTATWRPLSVDDESEPDDLPADANQLALDRPMRGYLGKANDIDFYLPTGDGTTATTSTTLEGTVSGIEGVDLRIIVVPAGVTVGEDFLKPSEQPPAATGKGTSPALPKPPTLPAGAQLFDAGGLGAPEHFSAPWPAGTSAPLVIVQRKDRVPAVGARRSALVGIDVGYSITVTRK